MKILILGSQGFIGRHLVSHFIKSQHAVTGCGLSEFSTQIYRYRKVSILSPDFESLFHGQSYDVCINASGSGNVPFSVNQPLSDFESNTMAVAKVLDTIRKHNPLCKYLHISSAAVYGNPLSVPITEESLSQPVSPYGWHKLMAEQLCKEYHEIYDLQIVIARPFSVYGPGLRKQLFWDLFQKYRQDPTQVEVSGTGKESRDFIHITDLIAALELLINKAPMNAGAFNIASGIETEINRAVRLFFSFIDDKTKVLFNGNLRAGDPLKWRADIDRLASLGFQPQVSLSSGLNDLNSWLKSNDQIVLR